MALLELLVFTGILAFIASKLSDMLNKRNSLDEAAGKSQAAREETSRRVLDIEGTSPWTRDKSFLSGFGLNPRFVADIRVWEAGAGESLNKAPPRVQACLRDTHSHGQSRGLEATDAIYKEASLEGKALYFVLYQPVPSSDGVLVTFVDKVR